MQSEVNYALDLPNENVSWNWKASMPLIITSVESFTGGSCEEHNFLFNAHNAQLTRKLQPSLDPMRAFNEMFQFISASRGFRQSSMTSSSLSWNCHIAISPINSTKPKPIPRPVRIGSKKKFAIQTELAFIKKLSAIINRSWIQVEQSMALRSFQVHLRLFSLTLLAQGFLAKFIKSLWTFVLQSFCCVASRNQNKVKA